MTYAASTSVPVEKSRAEIEQTLQRYGADAFMYGTTGAEAMVQFRAHDRLVRFIIVLPDRADKEFTLTPSRNFKRNDTEALKAWEQACRQKWRALALVVKAKLEAVEAGISVFEDEFLAHTVLPNGDTVSKWLQPQIAEAYRTGKSPAMLLELTKGQSK